MIRVAICLQFQPRSRPPSRKQNKIDMTCEVIGYCPGPQVGFPASFLANLHKYRTTFPVVLYSDEPKWGLRYCESPEIVRNKQWKHTISNYAFLMGLQYAVQRQLTYFIYLESDVRLGAPEWDGRMYEEAIQKNPHFVLAGSPVCYQPSNSGHSVLKRAIRYAHSYLEATGLGMPMFGYHGSLSLFVNGAGAIYKTEIVEKIFRGFLVDMKRAAFNPRAFDYMIGHVMFEMFGESVFDLIVPLTCSYSGVTDDLVNWPQRQHMLESGQKCLIHQCKSSYPL